MTIGKLEDMIELQRKLQIDSYKQDPQELKGHDRVEFIRWNMLALEDELHEALGEVGWKPWAKSRHVNEPAFHGEMVDAFHFFMNLMLVTGMTADDLYDGYIEKRKRNAKRQEDGYDGVANKCPTCRRDIDDVKKITSDLKVMATFYPYCSFDCAAEFVGLDEDLHR